MTPTAAPKPSAEPLEGRTPDVPHLAAADGTVVVYSDIGCPWATLALHHLRRAIRRAEAPLAIDHRAFPLELFNSRPTPKEILDPEVAAVAEREPALGWTGWQAPPSTYPDTTLPAMEAVQAAKDPRIGGLEGSDQLDEALRAAFYTESRCVSVHSELIAVARRCSLVDSDALDDALRSGTYRRALFTQWEVSATDAVRGSPHLFLTDGTNYHNPGIAFDWPDGEPRPVIHAYQPGVWDRLVTLAVTAR
ncbi:DsbA family protein [Streptomyces sp. NPDC002838]|uniref:DsbA family oxidoreductase n=1 Tax=Streptomyces sp. NPDC002838 TaxID=3154436 RepID=UPI00332028B4